MIKQFLAGVLTAALAVACHAAVDANRATQAELETVKGIGPSISGHIIDERKKGAFKDWQNLIDRVKGIGEGNAEKFSAEGLTVNGAPYRGSAARKKDDAKPAPVQATRGPIPPHEVNTTQAPKATADDKKAAQDKDEAKSAKAADAHASEAAKK